MADGVMKKVFATGGGRTNHPLWDERDTKFAVTCHKACITRGVSMSPTVTAMRCNVRCAGRTVASFIVLCLLLCRGDLLP